MTVKKELRVTVSLTRDGAPTTRKNELWHLANEVRTNAAEDLDITIQPVLAAHEQGKKGVSGEVIAILIALATYVAKPALAFIIELLHVLNLRHRGRFKLKANGLVVEVESADLPLVVREIEDIVSVTMNRQLAAKSDHENDDDADIEIEVLSDDDNT